MHWLVTLAIATALSFHGPVYAQKEPAPTGGLTGHVTCSDTQSPARFAEVMLIRRPGEAERRKLFITSTNKTGDAAIPDNDNGDEPQPVADRNAEKRPVTVDRITAQTGMDGSFTLRNVPVGEYWVLSRLSGYTVPVADTLDVVQQRDLDKMMAALPLVRVEAGHLAKAEVRLVRGAVVTGRVLFEDGSPAVKLRVEVARLQPQTHKGSVFVRYRPLIYAYGDQATTTDDEGRFRVSGLLPGKYFVAATLTLRSSVQITSNNDFSTAGYSSIEIYDPGKFRKADAKEIVIHGDETIRDADVRIDLSATHSVRGRVLALEDRHVVSDIEISALREGERNTISALLEDDGSFHLDYLPPGNYTITFTQARDTDDTDTGPDEDARVIREFDDVKTTVVVGEHDVTMDEVLLLQKKPRSP